MPKARSIQQCEYSLSMALAAIEIYNKPGFHNREHVFCMTMVNAWESLAKAKLLKDNRNRLSAIRQRNGTNGPYARTRHGDYKTIDAWSALVATVDSFAALENINNLIRLRNQCVHYMPKTRGLVQLVHSLATASLDNYAHYISAWFDVSVSKYNFFILPLGFDYPFTTLSAIDLRNEPEVVKEVIRGVMQAQQEGKHQDGQRTLVLEIGIDLASAKKAMRTPDFYTTIEKREDAAVGFIDQRDFNDRYPYKFTAMQHRVTNEISECGRNEVIRIVKEYEIKKNLKLSAYFFTDREDRERGVRPTTQSRYNDDCVRFIIATYRHERSS